MIFVQERHLSAIGICGWQVGDLLDDIGLLNIASSLVQCGALKDRFDNRVIR